MLRTFLLWDRRLLSAALALAFGGALAMASASVTVHPGLVWRHGAWLLIGLLLHGGLAATNYRRWMPFAVLAYGLSLAALAVVLVSGTMRLGATRWLSVFGLSLQPSEFAKLATTGLLAQYLGGQPRPLPSRALAISLGLAAGPALLVFIQPDLGSATVFGAIWLGMVWVAGASRRAILGFGSVGVVCLPFAWHLLRDYQRDRLLAFLNPHADPLGTGYTVIQSTIAIGSGRLWGKGWFAGTQNQLSFLPERHSDFIFSVIGEEWGLLGCLAVVAAFGLLLSRAVRIAMETSESQGALLAAGVCSWIGYQAVVNMGMVMGLLPVVGVPLPFISYGGSSMVALWVALGLLQSVRRMELV